MKTITLNKSNLHQSKDIWQKRQSSLQNFLKKKLVLSLSENIHFIDLKKILYLSANGNYSYIFLEDDKKILSSKTLKYFELQLIDKGFLRVHSSHLVNLRRITGICRENRYSICLDTGKKIPISKAYKSQLFVNNTL